MPMINKVHATRDEMRRHRAMNESTTLGRIKTAYASAASNVLPEDGPLPKWENLPIGLREAFITVFTAGGLHALDEFERKGKHTQSTDTPCN